MLYILLGCNILLVIGLLISNKLFKNKDLKSLIKFVSIVFISFSILEITIFNIDHYKSLNYKEINLDYTLGDDLKLNNDGSITVIGKDKNYIEFNNIYQELKNIYISISHENHVIFNFTIGYTDEANSRYAYTQSSSVMAGYDQYHTLHLSGKSKKIRVYFNSTAKDKGNDTFTVNKISFNKPSPLNASIIRPCIITMIALLIYLFRPKSFIYQYDLFNKKTTKFLILYAVIQIGIFAVVGQVNRFFTRDMADMPQRYQYQLLTEALMKGQTHLDIEPSPILKSLSNPYDKNARKKAFENSEETFIWDVAYFNEKYYVYFGIAPVITYYLPFYALTGHHINTSVCITITSIFAVIGILLLLKEICKKWFKNIKIAHFIMIAALFINACGLLSIMGRPDHYSLPIIMGITFSIFGLYFWLKATNTKNLKKRYLFLGSLCMAAVAASRPQLLLFSFVAIPIFWDYVFKKRELFSKKSIKETIAVMLPYIVIALLLMYYNYIRFGSPFDFGANYNLTTNDMTRRGFVFERIPLGLFYYLFRPFNLNIVFPYFLRDAVVSGYMGTNIFEPMPGGFIFSNILCMFGLLIFKFKKDFKEKLPYKIGIVAVISAIFIIIVDTQGAGILPRYICDFGFLLYLATSIVLFNLLNKNKDTNILTKVIFICFIFGIIYNFLLLFSDSVLIRSPLIYLLRRFL